MKLRKLSVLVMLVAASAAMFGFGQKDPPSAAVTVPFFVEDSHGDPVSGFEASDLSILEAKKESRPIVTLRYAKEMPLRLGLLIDTSRSQQASDNYVPAIKAASDLLRDVITGPADRAFVVTFSAMPNSTGFKSKEELPQLKLDLSRGGGTALYDAVVFSCLQQMKKETGSQFRLVLIVLSDGQDNQSHVTADRAIASAQATGTIVFAVSTANFRAVSENRGDRPLKRFASETGGDVFLGKGPNEMPKVFAAIKAKIDSMNSATFVPSELDKPERPHPIELKMSNRKWKVHAPNAYYITAAAQ